MSVSIIINPKSGGATLAQGQRRAELASRLLMDAREDGDIVLTDSPGHARELAAAAVRRGARLVIAWGGDGTVNEVASSLMFGPIPLGIVRSGSGNGLARELGVHPRADRAIGEALSASTHRVIDAGEIGGHVFFSTAGIGFDAHVAACFDRDPSGRRGLSNYVRLAVRESWRYHGGTYRIDDRVVRRAVLLTFANGKQFGNGARVAPDARVDDGALDLVTYEETSRIATLIALPRLFLGGLASVKGVRMERLTRATIAADGPILFHVDGEPRKGETRLDVRIHRAALRVAVR